MEEEKTESSGLDLLDRKEYLKVSEELERGLDEALPEIQLPAGESETNKLLFLESYEIIIALLKKYLDLKEEYYNIIALWILGTYFHKNFETYPYLFINAMKGSGKTRLLKLIKSLSCGGEMLNSLTEAVLFRQSTPLCIDEFESIGRAGNENLRELLNSCYKKGTKVKRMKKVKSIEGENQVVEEFEVFRPICMANIWGMEEVLGDRCINLTLEKSALSGITNLIEIWEKERLFKKFKKIMTVLTQNKVSVVLCDVMLLENIYMGWNLYINSESNNTKDINQHVTTLNTLYIQNTQHYTNNTAFLYEKIRKTGISGRNLELVFPLIIIASVLPDFRILEETLMFSKDYEQEKKQEEIIENRDILLIDFVSAQVPDGKFKKISELVDSFKQSTQINDEWLNSRWMGKALKRTALIKDQRRVGNIGKMYILNVEKALKKIDMFKPEDKS